MSDQAIATDGADQALPRRRARGRRGQPAGRSRRDLRLPRPQRRRQVHDDPDAARDDPADRRARRAVRRAGRAGRERPVASRRSPRRERDRLPGTDGRREPRRRPATGRHRRPPAGGPDDRPARARRLRAAGEPARCRSATSSGWPSPARCCTAPNCSSSTSRPTGSTRPASSRSASCSATWREHEGVTVFMSSHILGEVDLLATRIGIVHRGRLVEELDSDALEQRRDRRLEVEARDLEAAEAALLRGRPRAAAARQTGDSSCATRWRSRRRTRSPRLLVVGRGAADAPRDRPRVARGPLHPADQRRSGCRVSGLRAAVATELLKAGARACRGASPSASRSRRWSWACSWSSSRIPKAARALGLLGAKAQLTAGTADWPTYCHCSARRWPSAGRSCSRS